MGSWDGERRNLSTSWGFVCRGILYVTLGVIYVMRGSSGSGLLVSKLYSPKVITTRDAIQK
jgi:hypothetical protein